MKKVLTIAIIAVLSMTIAACTSEDVTNDQGLYNDGTYAAQGDKWDFGHEEATVVISDGEIQEVELKRIYTDGNEVDYAAYHEMGGPDLSEAILKLSNSIIDAQTFDVDSVSGATVSSNNWKTAVERALEEAK